MRMNVRLIRASQFLRQFQLDVCHKSDNDHIISDVLSRLTSFNHNQSDDSNHFKLDAFHVDVFVQMSKQFYDRLVKDY